MPFLCGSPSRGCRLQQVLREQVRNLQYGVRSTETKLDVSEKRVAGLEAENAALSQALRVGRGSCVATFRVGLLDLWWDAFSSSSCWMYVRV